MRIVLTGGGTGGHITPTLAVAHELKRLQPHCRITYIIERKAKFGELVTADPAIDEVRFIFAGKLRRYHGESWLRRLTDIRTIALNLRDFLYFALGFLQSLWLMLRLRPAVVFVKGGYVGLPVGAAAAFWRRPIVTHDSDTIPGLTNRVVARWARIMATAFPAKFYAYPAAEVRHVGVPVSDEFHIISAEQKRDLRKRIGAPADATVLFVTGGSLGAQRLNQAVAALAPKLLVEYPNLFIVHQTGSQRGGDPYATTKSPRVMVREFVRPLADYAGAADLVVARPGATTIAELAALRRTCIVVPSPFLAEGHQIKNAAHLAEQGAVALVEEGAGLPERLHETTRDLLDRPAKAGALADKLHELLRPDAAHTLAVVLLEQAKR